MKRNIVLKLTGIRSPEAEMDPRSGTMGVNFFFKRVIKVSKTFNRSAEWPLQNGEKIINLGSRFHNNEDFNRKLANLTREFIRMSIAPRVIASGITLLMGSER
jgi:hypothetical protein